MLNWLKSLFGSGGGRPAKTVDIEAHLSAVDPASPLHGDAEFEAWEDGGWSFEAEVEGPDHGPPPPAGLTVVIDGKLVGPLTLRGDEAELKLRSGQGVIPVVPAVGSTVEIHGPTGVLLTGTFQQDR